jgi:hypothetical protein
MSITLLVISRHIREENRVSLEDSLAALLVPLGINFKGTRMRPSEQY